MTGIGIIVLSLGLVVFAGPVMARLLRGRTEEEVADDYEPFVTVITPMFNEGEGIRRTIRSILAQNYPEDKLSVIVVDDCSTDDSYAHAADETRQSPRARVLRNIVNVGKRHSIKRAVREATSEIVVSVDSDVILDPDAVRNLVRRFTSPKIAAVGGRVDILNRENWLTRMQAVEYYFGYQFLKGLERAFRAVMCLSGCLTAYRRSVLLELEPLLERRNILGVAIKYGEDRFLTRQIIKAGYETTMTLDAVCRTTAPSGLQSYFAQQLRWRRSNIVDYVGGMSHVWRLHSVVAVHYYSVFALILAYPVLLLQSLVTGTFWTLMTDPPGVGGGHGRHLPQPGAQDARRPARVRLRRPAAGHRAAGLLRDHDPAGAAHARLRQVGDARPRGPGRPARCRGAGAGVRGGHRAGRPGRASRAAAAPGRGHGAGAASNSGRMSCSSTAPAA